ncbi:hypothetical protein PAXRUDRAFT_835817 [Paxillus rubicundulus Ve08.2h10]|uniref:Extracellular metalloproteinase n=1 Tax=Paxillus rubicundulus Ve08.2h10 TaxID=930991 RepID=A0A0D0CVD7_9AGAM|nr:hypothetical protein PAXRUDRAFT_835817 [Paxillus rubicundulus Ve08.2h10]
MPSCKQIVYLTLLLSVPLSTRLDTISSGIQPAGQSAFSKVIIKSRPSPTLVLSLVPLPKTTCPVNPCLAHAENRDTAWCSATAMYVRNRTQTKQENTYRHTCTITTAVNRLCVYWELHKERAEGAEVGTGQLPCDHGATTCTSTTESRHSTPPTPFSQL